MTNKNFNLFFVILLLLVLIVVGYRYKIYLADKNFIGEVNTICDLKTEKCFSPSADFGFLDTAYKKVRIIANRAPKCLEEHNCESFSCPTDLKNNNECQITYCSADTKIEGEECLVENINP
jgi:hypothetical protein